MSKLSINFALNSSFLRKNVVSFILKLDKSLNSYLHQEFVCLKNTRDFVETKSYLFKLIHKLLKLSINIIYSFIYF
jgi:hypothetical protein